ncbi:hypothetical protein DSM43276_01576 [Mycobacteroides salmoniphilum]|nr:hypothetical protein DSM43276_01576 [Mycobacteroides salmoniphilum]
MAQARTLLVALYEHVNEVAQSMAEAEHLIRRTPRHGSPHRHHRLRVAAMRKNIYEAQRLIKQLHQRFPAIRDTVWPPADPSGGRQPT